MQGRPLEVQLTPGQQYDSTIAEDMIDFISGTACLADGRYDATRIINEFKDRGINPVIPPSRNRKTQRGYDKKLYKERYLVEVFFHNLFPIGYSFSYLYRGDCIKPQLKPRLNSPGDVKEVRCFTL